MFIIKGKKVNLRETLEQDIKQYEKWNVPHLKAWQYDGPWYDEDLSAVINMRKRFISQETNTRYPFLEIETIDGVHIGWVNVFYREYDPHMTEIGIDIVEDAYWRQGLGYEALSLWIDYLFKTHNFTRLGFETWSGNQGMINLGYKLGFKLEGVIRKGCKVKGHFYDRIKLGLLQEEWI